MNNCRDVERLFAPYVDGETAAAERASIDGHLERCPECRHRVERERTARTVVVGRRECLRVSASPVLRARCTPSPAAAARAPVFGRRVWLPLSVAATLVLAGATALVFVFNDPVQALATHLADDHDRCFLAPPAGGDVDVAAVAAAWQQSQGWPLHIASASKGEQLELLGLRRCRVSEGRTAHLLYRWRGEPLSVFVLPQAFARLGVEQIIEQYGHEAIVWCDRQRGRTYVVVLRVRPRDDVAPVVAYLKVNTE